MKLPADVRYVPKRAVALAMAQNPFPMPIRSGIWVDCIECGRQDALLGGGTVGLSDDEAQRIFEGRGWSVKPTLCPDHSACGAPSQS